MDTCHYKFVQTHRIDNTKIEHLLKTMDCVWCATVSLSIVTNVPLWWGVLIKGETMHVLGVTGKSLYFLLNFIVNLKLLLENKVFF